MRDDLAGDLQCDLDFGKTSGLCQCLQTDVNGGLRLLNLRQLATPRTSPAFSLPISRRGKERQVQRMTCAALPQKLSNYRNTSGVIKTGLRSETMSNIGQSDIRARTVEVVKACFTIQRPVP